MAAKAEEMLVKPEELKNVRVAAFLDKRQRGFPHSWRQRYCVLSGNFIFIYNTPRDPKPKRAICIDEAAAQPSVKGGRAHPFAFSVAARGGKEYIFAADQREDRDKWIASISNAGYGAMYARTREAVRFLERCKDGVSIYLATMRGVSVPPPSTMLLQGVQQASNDVGSPAGGGNNPINAAAAAVAADPQYAPYHQLRSGLTGADILDALVTMRTDAAESRSRLRHMRDENADLKRQMEAQATALADALTRLAEATTGGGPATAKEWAAERDDLRKRVNELSLSNADLLNRLNDVSRELQVTKEGKAKLAARMGSGMAMAVLDTPDVASLRGRVRELEDKLLQAQQAQAAMDKAAAASGSSSSSSASGSSRLGGAGASANAFSASASRQAVPPPAQPDFGAVGRADRVAAMSSPSNANPLASSYRAGSAQAAAAAAQQASQAQAQAQAAVASGEDPALVWEHEWAPFAAEAQRLEAEDRLPEAEGQYRAVLEAKAERLGADSPAVAAAHRDLGRVLTAQQRYAEAEAHYVSCAAVCSSQLGEGHPSTACALTDLAAVLREQSKFAEAEAYAQRAVNSLKAGVGGDDVSTATALYNLAGLAKRQSKWREAEAAYGEALKIFRARLGEGVGEVADTLYQMGCLYRKRGEVARATAMFTQAADSYSAAYGPDDKRVAEASKRARAMADKMGAPAATGPGSASRR